MTLLDEIILLREDRITDLRAELNETNGLMRLAFEIIAEQQEIITAQATLLMVSLDAPNVRQTVKVSVIERDGD